jgi:hypothetical protein
MAQHDGTIDDANGATVLADLNAAVAAARSNNSGASAPPSPVAHMTYADTALNVMRRRNAANSGWILDGTLAQSLVSTRTSNTPLAAVDFNTTILASGTWTQTLDAASVLGAGWFVDYVNDGVGIITIDPNGSELINGSGNYVLGPGAAVRILCVGSAFKVVEQQGSAAGEITSRGFPTLQDFLNAVATQRRDGYIDAGEYPITEPLTFTPVADGYNPPPAIRMSPRAKIKAMASMDVMLSMGTAAGDYSGMLRKGLLQGGIFDCNHLANTGVHVVFLNHFMIRDTQVWNYNGQAFKAGSTSAPQGSYEMIHDNVRTWTPPYAYKTITGISKANPGVVISPGHGYTTGKLISIQGVGGMTQVNNRYFVVGATTTNTYELAGENTTSYGTYTSGGLAHITVPDTTRGIYYENCGDNHVINSLIQGCYRGIDADNGGGIGVYTSKFVAVHVWNFFENGEMEYGGLFGGDNSLLGFQVDGPVLYAYGFKDLRNSMSGCNLTLNDAYGTIDNRTSAIRLLSSGAGVKASGCTYIAQSPSYRIARDVAGDLTNYESWGTTTKNCVVTQSGPSKTTLSTWARITGGASPAITKGQNVASVVRNSTGVYTVTLSQEVDQNNPSMPGVIDNVNPVTIKEDQAGRTTTTIKFICYLTTTGAAVDPAAFTFGIAGGW